MANVNWTLWEKLLLNGDEDNTTREVVITEALNNFLQGMTDDPAYQAEATVNGVVTPMLISQESTIKCSLKAAPNTDINIGDLVGAFDEDWLVVELYADKLGIINAVLWMCNAAIKFQNNSETVYTRRCVIDDGAYTKIPENAVAYQAASTYKIYLSLDEQTKYLFIDKRLAVGKAYDQFGNEVLEAYKISGIDKKTKNFGAGSHLLTLSVQRSVYDAEADSLEDVLCDKYKGEESGGEPSVGGKCYIRGRGKVRIGTSARYIPIFEDAGGEVIPGVSSVWSVTVPTGVSYDIDDDGTCVISVPLDQALVGKEVELVLSDDGGEYGNFNLKVQVISIG